MDQLESITVFDDGKVLYFKGNAILQINKIKNAKSLK